MKTLISLYFFLRITSFFSFAVFLFLFLIAPISTAQITQNNYERELATPHNSILKINLSIDTLSANSTKNSYEISSKPQHGSIDLKEAIAV